MKKLKFLIIGLGLLFSCCLYSCTTLDTVEAYQPYYGPTIYRPYPPPVYYRPYRPAPRPRPVPPPPSPGNHRKPNRHR